MLILQRKAGESLQIGEDILVTVVSAENGRARLAIEAPKSIPILRSELKSAMDVNRDAANEQAQPLELLSLLDAARENPPKPGRE